MQHGGRIVFIVLSISIIFHLIPLQARANDISQVRWITESWPNFTEKHGTGLYHDLIKEVFVAQGVRVETTYAPWIRAVEEVKSGSFDMTGGIERTDDFHQSRYPILQYSDAVVFKKSRIHWMGLESLKGKRGVWVRGYFSNDDLKPEQISGIEVVDFISALEVLKVDRADYFIGGEAAMKNHALLVEDLDTFDFEIITLRKGYLYMSFPKTERGAIIRDAYDCGIERLTMQELSAIYEKWGEGFPVLEIGQEACN